MKNHTYFQNLAEESQTLVIPPKNDNLERHLKGVKHFFQCNEHCSENKPMSEHFKLIR